MVDKTGPVAIGGLHHFAYKCRNAEETRHFYEDILGLPLTHVIRADKVPSTGEDCPYVHLFFQMGDKSCLAFFDLGDGQASLPSPNTPSWVNHLALRVSSLEDLQRGKQRLEEAGIDVLGITDHGFVRSIYFFDPNGIRLELTVPCSTPEQDAQYARQSHQKLSDWTSAKIGIACRGTSFDGVDEAPPCAAQSLSIR